jgi:hypothetical protein
MNFYDDVLPRTYEITWQSGHVETVTAHQISYPSTADVLFGRRTSRPARVDFHAQIDGMWALQLSALEDDIRTIRDVTDGERINPTAEETTR